MSVTLRVTSTASPKWVGGGLNGVGEGVRAGLEIVLSDASGDAIRGDGDLTAGVDGEIAIRGGGSRSAPEFAKRKAVGEAPVLVSASEAETVATTASATCPSA